MRPGVQPEGVAVCLGLVLILYLFASITGWLG